jgi:hypothetical protein
MEDERHHVATTTAPAMTFAQLMELNMATATTIASITATMGSMKEATTANSMSIDHIVMKMKKATMANATSIARLVTESATFITSLADQTAAVEAQSFRDTIVVRANNEFVVRPAALPNHIEAAIWQVQATRDLLSAPLDALLANIEREDIEEWARMTPLVVASSTPSASAGNLRKAPATPHNVASTQLLAVDYNIRPAREPPLVGASSLPSTVGDNLPKTDDPSRPPKPTPMSYVVTVLSQMGGDSQLVSIVLSTMGGDCQPSPPSYVGTVFLTVGGDCSPVSLVPLAASAPQLVAIGIQTTEAHNSQPPCRRTGCCHQPRAPDHHNEAPPSSLLPLLGGAIMTMMSSSPELKTSYVLPSHIPVKGNSTTSLSRGGDSHCFSVHLTSIFNQAGFDVLPFFIFVEHDMANVPPIYAFRLFVVVVVSTALVPPIQLIVLMGFLGYLIVVFFFSYAFCSSFCTL